MDQQLTSEVQAAVRAAAAAVGGYTGELDAVYRRARRRRRRQAAATFGGVAVLLAAVGVGVGVQRDPVVPAPHVQPAVTSAPATPRVSAEPGPPAQRLLLGGAMGKYRLNGVTTELGGGKWLGELRPDGSVVRHRMKENDNWDDVVALPDGRMVALGTRDTSPDVPRTDGPNVAGVEFNLVVVGADGKVQLRRDIRRRGESVKMVTATGRTAYLWRPGGLVSHDLATGAERLLVPRGKLGVADVFDPTIASADLVGDRLVVAKTPPRCDISAVDPRTDTVVPLPAFATVDCKWVLTVRLSPDGGTVAATYQNQENAYRIALIRATDGTVLADREAAPADTKDTTMMLGIAWQDDRTLRGVQVPLGNGTQELRTFTVTAD